MDEEIKVFLSSPQSFELIEKPETKKIVRRKKRRVVCKKLLIKNILIEKDLTKLTVRQRILNEKFRQSCGGLDNISLINSGIDLIPYNINNTTSLGDIEEKHSSDVKSGTAKGCTTPIKSLNKEKMACRGGMISDDKPKPSRKKRRATNKYKLGLNYYNKLYEDCINYSKPSMVNRNYKIRLTKILCMDDIYILRLPMWKENNLKNVVDELTVNDETVNERTVNERTVSERTSNVEIVDETAADEEVFSVETSNEDFVNIEIVNERPVSELIVGVETSNLEIVKETAGSETLEGFPTNQHKMFEDELHKTDEALIGTKDMQDVDDGGVYKIRMKCGEPSQVGDQISRGLVLKLKTGGSDLDTSFLGTPQSIFKAVNVEDGEMVIQQESKTYMEKDDLSSGDTSVSKSEHDEGEGLTVLVDELEEVSHLEIQSPFEVDPQSETTLKKEESPQNETSLPVEENDSTTITLQENDSTTITLQENDPLEKSPVPNDFHEETITNTIEESKPVVEDTIPSLSNRNCFMKVSMYLEIVQMYLNIHKCDYVKSLVYYLKFMLQRIDQSKCICDIEKDLIELISRIEECKGCR